MWAWRLSRGFMVAGPLLFLAGVALNGHAAAPEGPNRVSEDKAHQRLKPYVQPVLQVENLAHEQPKTRDAKLEGVTALWMDAAESRQLKTVYASEFGVIPLSSVTNDIKLAKLFLLSQWTSRVLSARDKKDYQSQAKALATIIEISAIDKYADFALVHQFASLQTKTLGKLLELSPLLNDSTRDYVSARLSAAQSLEESLVNIAGHVKQLHAEYLIASKKEALPIEVANCYVALAEAAEKPSRESLNHLRLASRNALDDEFIKIGMAGRMAVKAEAEYSETMSRTLNALQSTK